MLRNDKKQDDIIEFLISSSLIYKLKGDFLKYDIE